MRHLILLAFALVPWAALADIAPRDGWTTVRTEYDYETLLERTREAVKASPLNRVFEVGPTDVAARRGFDIPGNRVLGVFNNDYAVEIIGLSEAAMIEAPLRLYVTENDDGTATLSYKTPFMVFEPYYEDGGAALRGLATELDFVLLEIAQMATGQAQ